jgi:hypothetical protein
MNTWIWGPPKWKFLHTLSFAVEARVHASTIALFLNTMQFVLPCKYCRQSYAAFVSELQSKSRRSLTEVISQGKLAKWMYDLHDKVNGKLDQQLVQQTVKEQRLRTTVTEQMALCRKRQITFECLSKRFLLRPVAYCDADIWEFLHIFALNMDLTKQDVDAQTKEQWKVFLTLLPRMLQVCNGGGQLVSLLTAPPVTIDSLVTSSLPRAIFTWVVQQKAAYDGKPFIPHMVQQAEHTYNFVRASVCEHGSCK